MNTSERIHLRKRPPAVSYGCMATEKAFGLSRTVERGARAFEVEESTFKNSNKGKF